MKLIAYLSIILFLLTSCGQATNSSAKRKNDQGEISGYPQRPIKLYVGFQPGGGTDLTARAVASLAREYLGQPVIVVNMPGASSTLAAKKVAAAKPDGYSLLVAGGSETVSVGHYKKLPYHPLDDFSPVIRLTVEKIVLSVHADSKYDKLEDLVNAASLHPGEFTYASSGQFGIFHSAALVFCMEAGIRMKHVPYNGGAPSVAALMGEHVDLTFTSPVSVASLHNSSQLKCLAQCSPGDRSVLLQDVPTMKESGYSIGIENQKGIVAPKGTPAEYVEILHECFKMVLESEEFVDIAARLQLETAYLGPEDFKTSLRSVHTEIGELLNSEN